MVGPLDPGNELPDFIVRRYFFPGNGCSFRVKAADEADLFQDLLRRVGDEVKDPVLLPDLRCNHVHTLRESGRAFCVTGYFEAFGRRIW